MSEESDSRQNSARWNVYHCLSLGNKGGHGSDDEDDDLEDLSDESDDEGEEGGDSGSYNLVFSFQSTTYS